MTLPTGTVTFLFTDIEGSTRLAQQYPDAMPTLLARHHEFLRGAIQAQNGYVFQNEGDSLAVAFHSAIDALNAAISAQRLLQNEPWSPAPIKVRMGIHTGTAQLNDTSAPTVYRGYATLATTQRVMSAGHGGQVLLSGATRELVRDSLPTDTQLIDLGEKRLKDLLRPEHLFQLNIAGLQTTFPPLKTLEVYRHNLPSQITSFIGREHEMAEVKNHLTSHRLVTLTGSGGTGKTRLSLQVAADLLDSFPDGVWFVELAPLTDPDNIPQTIHTALGLFEQPGKSLLQMLMDFLREKNVLIILDNCEHLIEACAQLTDTLLTHSKALKILASSREALGVKGELAWRVPSLSLPDLKRLPELNGLTQYEAVRLFIDRATLANRHFMVTKDNAPAIAQICHRLDGIPLALELAAARLKALSLEQITARLDDRFRLLTGGARTALPRQQTLRALIDWSYNLLSEKEKTLFRRLAVFAGGWTLEAAEAVCSDDSIEAFEVLDVLSSLVDKSLVTLEETAGKVRYRRLETIRQYAREKFFDTEEVKTIRERHFAWMLEWAEKMQPELRGRNEVMRLKQVKAEVENIRSAVEWGFGTNQIETSMMIVLALSRFWDGNHPYQESRGWLEKGLASRADLTKRTLVRTLSGAIWLADRQNDLAVVNRYAEENLALVRELDDKRLTAYAFRIMAVACVSNGNFSGFEQFHEKALSICQELGDKELLDLLIGGRVVMLIHKGDVSRAHDLLEEYQSLYGDLQDSSQAWFYGMLGGLKALLGQLDSAVALLEKSLLLYRQLNHAYFISLCILGFANVANSYHDPVRAARLLGARYSINESVGALDDNNTQRFVTSYMEKTKSMIDEEAFQAVWEEGQAMTLDQAIEYALEVTRE